MKKNHDILIVDDNDKRRNHLKEMILGREAAVREAQTAEAALECLEAKSAGVVITETELPTRSGLYLLQEIKEHCPDTEVILTTHNASSFSLMQALRHGAFDFIVRPIDTSEILFNVIDRAFSQIDLRLQNRNLLAELAHRNHEMEQALRMMSALSEAIEKINSAIEISDLLDRLLNAALTTTKADKGLLALIRGTEGSHFGIKMSRGVKVDFAQRHHDQIPEGLLLDIARSGSPLIVPDELPGYMNERVSSAENHLVERPGLLSVPLYLRNRAIGVMILFGHAEGERFTDQNQQFLVQLAHHAAIALEKAGIIHQLKKKEKKSG